MKQPVKALSPVAGADGVGSFPASSVVRTVTVYLAVCTPSSAVTRICTGLVKSSGPVTLCDAKSEAKRS